MRPRLSRLAVDGGGGDDAAFTEGPVMGAGTCFGAIGEGWLRFTGETALATDFFSASSRFPEGTAA